MPVKASYLILTGAGGLIAYSGLKGKGIASAIRNVIAGQGPGRATPANPITSPTGSTSPGNVSGTVGARFGTGAPAKGYVNPFTNISNLVPERVDMGVDYSGTGPLAAIGSGRITSVTNPGWPGGTFICIKLAEGAYAGKYWYFAEDIHPNVRTGQFVEAGETIGTMYNGGSGIETGWAAPPGIGLTMAAISMQFFGSNTTAYGASANRLLTSVGAPSGIINNKPTGSVRKGYP